MNLNETIQYELENPNSNYNKYYSSNRLIEGKYEGDEYLLGIIRTYERSARAYLAEENYVEIGGKGVKLNEVKKAMGFIDTLLYSQ